MGLLKKPKKITIRTAASAGEEVSPLRPQFVPKTPPCLANCPCGTDVRGWLSTIAQAEAYGRTNDEALRIAWSTIAEANPLPAVCGRVCPHPCEDHCNRNSKDGAVAVNAVERFVGDFGIQENLKLTKLTESQFPEKVAIIGSGPAGLSCAYQLARRGYPVTVYERFDKPGGMLRYGIPNYRLPREVLNTEIRRILDLGVTLATGVAVGEDITLEELTATHQAVFVGIGAHRGRPLGVPGEDASNVFLSTEFLRKANTREPLFLGDDVIVIGGGDTAIDAARVSKRLGANVKILYRRTRTEMPAIKPEIDAAIEEGVEIEFLAAPVEVVRSNGEAVGLRCSRMSLGAVDSSGRRRPEPIPCSDFVAPASAIISAVGQEPEWGGLTNLKDGGVWIKADRRGWTGRGGVYAGGDDTGLGLVADAIGQGRLAAQEIDAELRGIKPAEPQTLSPIGPEQMRLDWYDDAPRRHRRHVPVDQRHMQTEIQRGLSQEEALEEAKRCMSCGMCMDCETCWSYCSSDAFERLPKGQHYRVKLERCNGCKKCAEACPCGYIDMV